MVTVHLCDQTLLITMSKAESPNAFHSAALSPRKIFRHRSLSSLNTTRRTIHKMKRGHADSNTSAASRKTNNTSDTTMADTTAASSSQAQSSRPWQQAPNTARGMNNGTDVRTHQVSGYQWTRDEDAPGYAWKSKKAREDAARAYENIVDKERSVAGK